MAHAHFMNLALAVEYGTNESLFLTNLCFWIEKNKANKAHFHKDRYWVYNTMEAWAELFPYFSKDQIRHLIDKMKRKKILLVGTFNRTRYDRTQWYSVSDEVLSLYASGSYLEKASGREEKPMRPGGHMHMGEVPDPSAPQGTSMWEKSHIEVADFPDRSGESPTPIPDSKPDKKQADAAASKTGQEPKVAAAVETVEIETLKEELGALDRQLVFDTTFYPKAAAYLAEERLGTSYLSWLYEECRKKNPDNLRGLYYVLFFQTDIRTVFRKQTRQKERVKARETVCPVCGMSYNARLTQCPGCSFNREDAGDENKIRRHKKYCELSPEDREAYELEQSKLFSRYAKNPACYAEIKDLWAAIEKKYHLRE